MADLKKCPFCGGEAELVEQKHREYASTYYVSCKMCNCKSIERMNVDAILEAWNNRATEAELRAKAIDEFAENVEAEILPMLQTEEDCQYAKKFLHQIATDMKGEKE